MEGSFLTNVCFLLGACLSSGGLRFQLMSYNATRVEVCLFSQPQQMNALECLPLQPDKATGTWTLNLSMDEMKRRGLAPTKTRPLYYGYRVWGPNWEYDPSWKPGSKAGFRSDVDEHGNRFNPNKLTLDPYALEISHGLDAVADHTVFETGELYRERDSAQMAPKGVIAPTGLTPFTYQKPTRALKDDVIYEVHVKGLTKADPAIPSQYRGTYKGAGMKARALKELGVTAVEFLPVHQKVSQRDNPNYWGYMTLGYFAPERSYSFDQSPGGVVREFREMVEAFHREGIKVYIDVVYNHTGEGGVAPENPSHSSIYSFRGIDNATYYELSHDKRHYMDNTGCGHNIATFREPVREFIMDSLRYWKDHMGVDGFRFDLAPVVGNVPRNGKFYFDGEDPRGVLKRAVAELPARPAGGGKGVDLIAEPWGIGEGTYQQGRFPQGWSEWNAQHFRDKVRSFFNKRGVEPVSVGEMANAVSGSAGLFQGGGRKPWNSVNIITAHDGFTLRDLFSYNHKNNNQPWPFGPSDGGEDHNRSWDQGGDESLQRQLVRTAMMTMLLSSGTPHINGGDEFYRTLKGNNNPWNLDSIANYLRWDQVSENIGLHEFVKFLLRFRKENPSLRPAEFYKGQDLNGNGLKDITWYGADGRELRSQSFGRNDGLLAYRLDATEFGKGPARSIFVAINGDFKDVKLHLPPPARGHAWFRIADSASWFEADNNYHPPGTEARIDGNYEMKGRCALLLMEKPVR